VNHMKHYLQEPLVTAIIKHDHTIALDLIDLIQKQAGIADSPKLNDLKEQGFTLLALAMIHKNHTVANKLFHLLKHDLAFISACDDKLRSHLWYAVQAGFVNIFDELVRIIKTEQLAGTSSGEFWLQRDTQHMSLLHTACHCNQEGIAFKLLDEIKREENAIALINSVTIDGFTALHYALFNNNEHLAESLIRHGADINVQDNQGQTYLELTNVALIRYLAENGAFIGKQLPATLMEALRQISISQHLLLIASNYPGASIAMASDHSASLQNDGEDLLLNEKINEMVSIFLSHSKLQKDNILAHIKQVLIADYYQEQLGPMNYHYLKRFYLHVLPSQKPLLDYLLEKLQLDDNIPKRNYYLKLEYDRKTNTTHSLEAPIPSDILALMPLYTNMLAMAEEAARNGAPALDTVADSDDPYHMVLLNQDRGKLREIIIAIDRFISAINNAPLTPDLSWANYSIPFVISTLAYAAIVTWLIVEMAITPECLDGGSYNAISGCPNNDFNPLINKYGYSLIGVSIGGLILLLVIAKISEEIYERNQNRHRNAIVSSFGKDDLIQQLNAIVNQLHDLEAKEQCELQLRGYHHHYLPISSDNTADLVKAINDLKSNVDKQPILDACNSIKLKLIDLQKKMNEKSLPISQFSFFSKPTKLPSISIKTLDEKEISNEVRIDFSSDNDPDYGSERVNDVIEEDENEGLPLMRRISRYGAI
jgi:hypothetical protein